MKQPLYNQIKGKEKTILIPKQDDKENEKPKDSSKGRKRS